MMMWLRLQDGLRGSAHENLNRLAEGLCFRDDALRWARAYHGDIALRVLGLVTLGHLGKRDDAALLRSALDEPLAMISLGAARALLQVNAEAYAPTVLDECLRRPDWPVPRVGTLLREAGAQAVAKPLIDRLVQGTADDQKRLLPLLRFAESPHGASPLHRVVEQSSDPQVLSIALRQLHGPDSLQRVRALCEHAEPLVRSAAAQALGQIGLADDRKRLEAMMSDRDWWVRYRAAQAQLKLPGTDVAAVIALRRRLTDRFARDALDHVCGELALREEAVAAEA
jgi:HEAT repeat protein